MAACDDEGFTVVGAKSKSKQRPLPKRATLADFMAKDNKPKHVSQKQWKNTFKVREDEDDSDDSSVSVQYSINSSNVLHVCSREYAEATVRGTARIAPKHHTVCQPKRSLGARGKTQKPLSLDPSVVPGHDGGARRPTPLGPSVPHDSGEPA